MDYEIHMELENPKIRSAYGTQVVSFTWYATLVDKEDESKIYYDGEVDLQTGAGGTISLRNVSVSPQCISDYRPHTEEEIIEAIQDYFYEVN